MIKTALLATLTGAAIAASCTGGVGADVETNSRGSIEIQVPGHDFRIVWVDDFGVKATCIVFQEVRANGASCDFE